MILRIFAISLLIATPAFSMNKQALVAAAAQKTYEQDHGTHILTNPDRTIKHYTVYTPNSATTHIHLEKNSSTDGKNYYLVRTITNNRAAQNIDIVFSGSNEDKLLNQRNSLSAEKAQDKFNNLVQAHGLTEQFPVQWLEEAVEKTK